MHLAQQVILHGTQITFTSKHRQDGNALLYQLFKMKQLIFILLFPPFFAGAQDITRDTSYLINASGKFFDITRVEYSDGTYNERATLVGDTTAAVSLYANQITNTANQYASAAIVAMRAQAATATLAKLDTNIIARIGRSPLTAVMASYEREFLEGSWEIQSSGSAAVSVTFPRLSTNQRIRMLPSGGTARTMLIFGNMLRLVNYPVSGNNTLFKVREGRWENLTRTIILRRTSPR